MYRIYQISRFYNTNYNLTINAFILFKIFRKKLSFENLQYKFKTPFLFSLTVTLFLFLLRFIFMSLHWPGGLVISVILLGSTLFTTILSGFYLYLNRKNFNRIAYEFIILFTPITLLSFIFWNSNCINDKEYAKEISQHYQSLNDISCSLYQQVQSSTDSSTILFHEINDIKNKLIHLSGGIQEDGSILGWKEKEVPNHLMNHHH